MGGRQDLLLALDLTVDFLDDLIGHIFGEGLPMPRLLIFYPYRYNIRGQTGRGQLPGDQEEQEGPGLHVGGSQPP